MSYATDLAILVFYQVALLANGIVGLWQAIEWLRTGKFSPLQIIFNSILRAIIGSLFYFPMFYTVCRLLGWYLASRSHAQSRRATILARTSTHEPEQDQEDGTSMGMDNGLKNIDGKHTSNSTRDLSFRGIIGFFHPFCNAGGGGERVLWAAIRATQEQYPNAICVVYTGDHDATKEDILARVKSRFNIRLQQQKVFFLYLSTRRYVLPSTWPRFTLLGQSLGSVVLALDAFSLLVPDVFIDTMGYAFALGCAKLCFPQMPTGAYVHYPTISTDMLGSLDMQEGKGVNAGAGKGLRGLVKRQYWQIFAWAYSLVGGSVDVVMANSSWTAAHIRSLWGPSRSNNGKTSDIATVFPPVAVEEISEVIEVSPETEGKRENILVYIAQFRPEKNHKLVLQAFSQLIHNSSIHRAQQLAKLVLIGSVRDSDDATRVYELRLLAHELNIKEDVEFVCDASWAEILRWLEKCSVGINGMWNEHFGIGVVEYQAAGLISVVNDSGGPKEDIVIDYQGGPTGFHASSPEEYASAFQKALSLSPGERTSMRLRARASAKRFNEEEFARRWLVEVDKLVHLSQANNLRPSLQGTRNFFVATVYTALLGYDIVKLTRL